MRKEGRVRGRENEEGLRVGMGGGVGLKVEKGIRVKPEKGMGGENEGRVKAGEREKGEKRGRARCGEKGEWLTLGKRWKG